MYSSLQSSEVFLPYPKRKNDYEKHAAPFPLPKKRYGQLQFYATIKVPVWYNLKLQCESGTAHFL